MPTKKNKIIYPIEPIKPLKYFEKYVCTSTISLYNGCSKELMSIGDATHITANVSNPLALDENDSLEVNIKFYKIKKAENENYDKEIKEYEKKLKLYHQNKSIYDKQQKDRIKKERLRMYQNLKKEFENK